MKRKFNFSQQGQTLIEVVVAIALGTIIIVALVGLSTRATRNSNAAKVSEVASKYAQEGLEVVRQARDLDAAIRCSGCGGATKWSELYNFNIGTLPFVAVPPGQSHAGFTCPVGSYCLDNQSRTTDVANAVNANIQGVTIHREIEISDSGAQAEACFLSGVADGTGYSLELDSSQVKGVTVKVTWNDPSGSHESKVQSCITKKS